MNEDREHKEINVTAFDPARRKLRPANDHKPPSQPILNLPLTVKWLCAATILSFIITWYMPDDIGVVTMMNLAFIPARYSGGLPLGWQGIVAPVTHLFLHGGWLHLGVNIGTLMAFGAGLEKAIGGRRLLILYFACGVLGAIAHFALQPHSEGPLIGASGAISGLFGGILIVMQRNGMMGAGFQKLLPFIAIWILVSVVFGYFGMPGQDGAIAWATHIGGFIAGLLLLDPVMKLPIKR